MDIKILSSATNLSSVRGGVLIIGTHNGIFHSDEVVACAILSLLNSNKVIKVIRSRNEKDLQDCDICVDIGGDKYDHHQSGFNITRDNGIKYASAGLVWRDYGKMLIKKLASNFFSISDSDINRIYEEIDNRIISKVDCEDNGVSYETHCFSFIPSFLPLWYNNSTDDFNNQFYSVLLVTINVLSAEIKTFIGKEFSKITIYNNWINHEYFNNGILEIPSQTMNWLETVSEINESTSMNYINFVIFPYPNGGWAAQCVPPSLTDKFSQRIPFPSAWAGQTKELSEITGILDATFCHNGCFFVRGKTKESVIALCNLATNLIN